MKYFPLSQSEGKVILCSHDLMQFLISSFNFLCFFHFSLQLSTVFVFLASYLFSIALTFLISFVKILKSGIPFSILIHMYLKDENQVIEKLIVFTHV